MFFLLQFKNFNSRQNINVTETQEFERYSPRHFTAVMHTYGFLLKTRIFPCVSFTYKHEMLYIFNLKYFYLCFQSGSRLVSIDICSIYWVIIFIREIKTGILTAALFLKIRSTYLVY